MNGRLMDGRNGSSKMNSRSKKQQHHHRSLKGREVDGGGRDGDESAVAAWTGQKSSSLPKEAVLCSGDLDYQVRLLQHHYFLTSREPPTIRCSIDLAPPMARVVCPQTKFKSAASSSHRKSGGGGVYGPDVPDSVVRQSKVRGIIMYGCAESSAEEIRYW